MKNYKKIIALCLIAVMTLCMLSACAGRSYTTDDKTYTGVATPVESLVQDTEEHVKVGQIEKERDPVVNDEPSTDTPDEGEGETETPTDTPVEGEGETETPTDTPVDTPAEEMEDYNTVCMSFNVLQWDTNHGGYATPATRAPWILDTIKDYDPDLLGTQELTKGVTNTAGWDMYQYLVDNLKSEYDSRSLIEEKEDGANVAVNSLTIGSGLVIFWKKDRFDLKDSGAQVYSIDSGRHYQWVKLYDNQEKITILMTNTHLSINGSKGVDHGNALRSSEAGELSTFWRKNCTDQMALYGTGDYNHTKSTEAFSILNKDQFLSSRDVCLKANASSNIDYIYINSNVQDCYQYVRCEETYEPEGVHKGDRNPAYCPSDHHAIVIYCSNPYLS
ncbi:MAG: hypothetical protein IKY33_02710 [Clostridia bacterium]|nr:hypothetical protein [Clostridia bacterium]